MSDSKFDLGDYVEVKDRIAKFYELFGKGRLVTAEVTMLTAPDNKQRVLVKALAYRDPDDKLPGVGHSWLEIPGKTPYTNGSEVENAETSAWGRAIGSLGILIDGSIASANEVASKQDDGKPQKAADRANGGIVGTVSVGKGDADFELRQTPTGHSIAFRLVEGRKSIKVVATDEVAEDLRLIRDAVLGKRVTAWGSVTDESFQKGERTITYQVLRLTRIVGPDWEIPAPQDARPAEPDLSDAEMDGIFAAVPKAAEVA